MAFAQPRRELRIGLDAIGARRWRHRARSFVRRFRRARRSARKAWPESSPDRPRADTGAPARRGARRANRGTYSSSLSGAAGRRSSVDWRKTRSPPSARAAETRPAQRPRRAGGGSNGMPTRKNAPVSANREPPDRSDSPRSRSKPARIAECRLRERAVRPRRRRRDKPRRRFRAARRAQIPRADDRRRRPAGRLAEKARALATHAAPMPCSCRSPVARARRRKRRKARRRRRAARLSAPAQSTSETIRFGGRPPQAGRRVVAVRAGRRIGGRLEIGDAAGAEQIAELDHARARAFELGDGDVAADA